MRYGCFDYDAFAAQLPDNVGMIEQDVDGMIAKVFALIEGGPTSPAHFRIPCILRTPPLPRG